MKPQIYLAATLVFFSSFSSIAEAQDFDDLYPFAAYTLINTAEDALGYQEPIELINAPFAGSNGVYCNGISPASGNPDFSYYRTPSMSALYDSVFGISLEFNLEALDGKRRAILILGQSYRYLGFEIENDTTFWILFNNALLMEVPGVVPQASDWYTLKVFHHENNGLNEFYLDDALVAQFTGDFIRPADDGRILNYNPSTGTVFKGYMRNLNIYGSEEVTGVIDESRNSESINLYPNPSNSMISIDVPEINATSWSISDLCGVNLLSGDMMDMQDELDIGILTAGVYILHLYDDANTPLAHKKFVKN